MVQFVIGKNGLVLDSTEKEEFSKLLKVNWKIPFEGVVVLRKFGGDA